MSHARRLMTSLLVILSVAGITVCSAWLGVLARSDDSTSVGSSPAGGVPVGNAPAGEDRLAWVDPATGALLPDKVPALVPVADRNDGHVVGYVKREHLYPEVFGGDSNAGGPFAAGSDEPLPVVDVQGNLVGHTYTDIGYVPLEESQAPGFDPNKLRRPQPAADSAPPTSTTPPR
jgi:hypothetical protein